MKTRRTFTKEFKVDLLRELESCKTTAQVCREHGLHPSLVGRWRREYLKNPEDAFSGNGNTYKTDAKLAEYERIVGKLYAENAFLKKVLLRLEEDAAERKKQDHMRGCM